MSIEPFLITPDSSIRDAMLTIDKNVQGIVLIADGERTLLGTVTDGDIRRAILNSISLEASVARLLERKKGTSYEVPIVSNIDDTADERIALMKKHSIRHLPIVDDQNHIIDLIQPDTLIPDALLPVHGVVMAGGFGTRLRPLTENLPKPMLPVGGRPLLQRTLEQFHASGIRRVNITTHYLPEKITDYFGKGEKLGLSLDYVNEDKPLGTAGALGLMEQPDEPLLVINGDILTQVDFRSMLKYHQKHKADLTMAVRQYEFRVPYGVVEHENAPFVRAIREKPTYQYLVNAGIYLIEPSAHKYIPSNQRFDMTDLMDTIMANGGSVVSFPIVEYWLDIGQHADYEQAKKDIESGRVAS